MDLMFEPFRRYIDFDGRSRRLELLLFIIFNLVVSLVVGLIDGVVGILTLGAGFGLFSSIYALVVIIPSIALGVRRLHDFNASGLWYLLVLIPVVNFILLLVLLIKGGTEGSNRFGPPPPA